MQKEETAFETLERFAENTKRKIEKFEHMYSQSSLQKIPQTKRWVTIEDNRKAFFFGYSSSSMSTSEFSLISGIAIPIEMHRKDFSLKMSQKNILDSFNFFKKNSKLDDRELDKEIVLKSTDMARCTSLLLDQKVKQQLLTTVKQTLGLNLEINSCQLLGIPSLKNENIICLYKKEWIFDPQLIETLFELAHTIHDKLMEKRIVTTNEG